MLKVNLTESVFLLLFSKDIVIIRLLLSFLYATVIVY